MKSGNPGNVIRAKKILLFQLFISAFTLAHYKLQFNFINFKKNVFDVHVCVCVCVFVLTISCIICIYICNTDISTNDMKRRKVQHNILHSVKY